MDKTGVIKNYKDNFPIRLTLNQCQNVDPRGAMCVLEIQVHPTSHETLRELQTSTNTMEINKQNSLLLS